MASEAYARSPARCSLVGVVTLLVGWVEDVAARRTPQLLAGRPPRSVADRAVAAPAGPAPAGAETELVAAGAGGPIRVSGG